MDDDGNDNMIHVTEDERVGDRIKNRPKLKSLPLEQIRLRIDPARRALIKKYLMEASKKPRRRQPQTPGLTINFSGPITIVLGDMKR